MCNDCLGEAQADPKGFVEKLVGLISGAERGEFGFGCCANGFNIIHNAHADATGLIAVGGNHATKLLIERNIPHHTEEGQVELLKALADKLGYSVRKRK
jgi:hypothetical protein